MAKGNIVDEIVIRVSADLQKLKADLQASIGELKGFQREVTGIDKSTQMLNQGLKAFSWTTFAQGALNASTAMAQLYTSISNLDRVQYQVRASMTAVEKAEDQLARKTLQLTRELEKNGSASEKAGLLRNEIATATEQLANKTERLKLAQDQANDTFILFGFNVANTVFGVLQTLIGLKTMAAQRVLANKLAIDQETQSLGLNTIAARANSAAHTGLAASRSGMVSGIAPMVSSLGGATGAVGKLTGVLGKAGLIGSLAAVGIGLGAFAFDQAKLNDRTQKSIEKSNDLSKSIDALALSLGSGDDVLSSFSLNMDNLGNVISGYNTNIDELISKIKDLKEVEADLMKDALKPSFFGPSGAEKAEAISKTQADLARAETLKLGQDLAKSYSEGVLKGIMGSMVDKGAKATFQELQGKELALGSVISQEVTKVVTDIDKIAKTTGQSFNKAAESVFASTDHMIAGIELGHDSWMDMVRAVNEYNKELEEANKKVKNGNDELKETIRLNRALAEQKKSLLAQFGYLRPGSNRRSFISGETNFFTGEEGPPFSGIINRRTSKFLQDGVILRAWNQIQGLTESAALAFKMNMDLGLDPMPTIRAYEQEINKIKYSTNFVASDPRIRSLAAPFSNAVAEIQRQFKALAKVGLGTLPTFGGADPSSKAYTKQVQDKLTALAKSKGFETPGSLFRDNAAFASHGRLGFTSSMARSTFARQQVGGGNRSVQASSSQSSSSRRGRGRSSRHGGRSYDPLGGMGISSAIESQARQDVIAQMQFLGGIIGVGINIQGTSGIDITPQLRGYRSPSAEYINSVVTGAIANYNASVQRYNAQLSVATHDVLTRVNPLGITTISGLYASVTDPLTYDDVDNRLRYNDRLAQISTGATVL